MNEQQGEYQAGKPPQIIQFWAVIYKVQTMVDHGIRVTLDLPEDAVMTMAELVKCKRRGIVLSFTAGALINTQEQKPNVAMATRSKRKSSWQAPKGPSVDCNA